MRNLCIKLATYILCLNLLVNTATVVSGDTFVDETGRRLVISRCPQRIVSLAPSITEILFALKLEERIVGVTRFSYYPEEAQKKPKIGAYRNPNMEEILALEPDLVVGIADGNPPDVIMRLEKWGIPVYLSDPKTVEGIFNTVISISKITGTQETAYKLVKDLRMRIKNVMNKVRDGNHPSVFLQINAKPIITVGMNTFQDQIIRMAGGVNIAGSNKARYPIYNIEEILRKSPDIIIISTMARGMVPELQRKEWMRWTSIPAVKQGRIFFINSDIIDRPSPRIVEGLEEMAKLLHPEKFNKWHE
nr:cobalamin-binding protein [Desulfobacterales bacterium]